MANSSPKRVRPLSPHLAIYKPTITMMMSIVHRITGVGLYFGMAILAWWLISASMGAMSFDFVESILKSFIGYIVMIAFTWALIHHALGGIRHFIWDLGKGLSEQHRYKIAWATIIGSASLTALLWIAGFILS